MSASNLKESVQGPAAKLDPFVQRQISDQQKRQQIREQLEADKTHKEELELKQLQSQEELII